MSKICPLCDHTFQGNGWDGIDAHWRSKHEDFIPYEGAWSLIQANKFPLSLRMQRANLPNLLLAEVCEAAGETAVAMAHIAQEQAAIISGEAGPRDAKTRLVLIDANNKTYARLKVEYDAYSSEIDRRNFPLD
jgi:hypothetical protein